mgnify:CR=1 FL=1
MRVAELRVYPIKSCAGVSLPRLACKPYGILHDREFMVVDSEGNFLTERTHPRMCLVKTELLKDELCVGTDDLPRDSWIRLPLGDSWGAPRSVRIFDDQCEARQVENPEVNEFFSDFLGVPCELVRTDPTRIRRRDSKSTGFKMSLSFQDGWPILVASVASLADLNSRLKEPITMTRFRPNIVVEDCEPYAEDDENFLLTIGDVMLRFGKLCDRCNIPLVDPETGLRGKEPLAALSKYRRGLIQGSNKVFFGANYLVAKSGYVSVGDEVEVKN